MIVTLEYVYKGGAIATNNMRFNMLDEKHRFVFIIHISVSLITKKAVLQLKDRLRSDKFSHLFAGSRCG